MNPRFLLAVLLVIGVAPLATGQILKPAKWEAKVAVTQASIGDTVEVVFSASIEDGWYIYSNDFDPDLGPLLTTFSFSEDDSYRLAGDPIPVGNIRKYDEIWEGEISIFKKKAEFRQALILKKSGLRISGVIEYQTCSEIDGVCIPFEDDFNLSKTFTASKVKSENNTSPTTEEQTATDSQSTFGSPQLKLEPANAEDSIQSESKQEVTLPESQDPMDASLIGFMIAAFLAGLLALVTPCVFPMIPMTVTFFMKGKTNRATGIRNGLLFSISIILIYTILGTLFAMLLGPDGLNSMATNWFPNLFAFIIFIVFALSFLGLFEINLPSSFVTSMDRKAEGGGLAGIFFMAFTLALVSFSCTVPIVGSVLLLSAGGQIAKPILGMLAFSLAFAIPFGLFAMFPQWLKSLPKSGGWLNSVKVVLGFLELALAFKFLSVADQAYHWNLLNRDIYLAIWIVIFSLMGFYLLGKIRLPNDSKLDKIPVMRLMLAILVFAFVTYLIPGLFGAPLKALSGYLPPLHSQEFVLNAQAEASSGSRPIWRTENACEEPKYGEFLHFPPNLGLSGYFHYDQALACARATGKPIFVDFTGHGCVNCREMEARVWSDPQVLDILKNEYIVLALYVDDKTQLPEDEWVTSSYDGKVKKTIGKKNFDFQISRFNYNAQPYYVLLDHEGELLVDQPLGYELDASKFTDYLKRGLKNFDSESNLAQRSPNK